MPEMAKNRKKEMKTPLRKKIRKKKAKAKLDECVSRSSCCRHSHVRTYAHTHTCIAVEEINQEIKELN